MAGNGFVEDQRKPKAFRFRGKLLQIDEEDAGRFLVGRPAEIVAHRGTNSTQDGPDFKGELIFFWGGGGRGRRRPRGERAGCE